MTALADCRIASWGMLDSIEAMASHLLRAGIAVGHGAPILDSGDE